jgi:hypothetical protein
MLAAAAGSRNGTSWLLYEVQEVRRRSITAIMAGYKALLFMTHLFFDVEELFTCLFTLAQLPWATIARRRT